MTEKQTNKQTLASDEAYPGLMVVQHCVSDQLFKYEIVSQYEDGNSLSGFQECKLGYT